MGKIKPLSPSEVGQIRIVETSDKYLDGRTHVDIVVYGIDADKIAGKLFEANYGVSFGCGRENNRELMDGYIGVPDDGMAWTTRHGKLVNLRAIYPCSIFNVIGVQ